MSLYLTPCVRIDRPSYEDMKIGIIGTGKHGTRYANHIVNDINGLTLAAISRRSREGKEQAWGWNTVWYADWRDLVSDPNVEAVIAVTVPSLNLEIAEQCVLADKPLLVEKPLSVDAQSAATMVDLFAKAHLGLTVGQTLRYNEVIRELKKRLEQIGRLYTFSANQRLEPSSLPWHEEPDLAGAGVSFHTAVHIFDALRFITGREITRVIAICARKHNRRLEDSIAILLEMAGGIMGTIDCSKIGHARSGRFEFVGLDGQLHGDQVHGILEEIRGAEITELARRSPGNTIISLLEDWRDFLAGKTENPVTGADGLAAVQACEACLKSASLGNWVELPG